MKPTEHSRSWEADPFSSSQEIPRILWNPKIYYGIRNVCPLPALSQINPFHAPSTSWRSILVLSSYLLLALTSCLSRSCFLTKTQYAPPPLPRACYMLRLSHSS